ncbi:transposase [Spirochaeta cellobiosiphila]|uniref:transposase n=1 Tax=Spirochaeta cellobiosiphila TaxID=504483 RepID=UPI00040F1C5D|nr:transposase [Spirochaeta cellobiosiphila]
MGRRKKYDNAFKLKVALEAIKEEITVSEIASNYEIHPQQVRQWKREFLVNAESVFQKDNVDKKKVEELETEKEDLQNLIGQQTIQINFLKKNLKKLNID